MGRAFILINDEVLARLRSDAVLIDQVHINDDPRDHGEGLWLLDVSSDLLPDNCMKQQQLVLEPLGFRPDLDT